MQDSLSQTFAALADPTRRAILAHLSKGDANVSDLARPFLGQMSLPGFAKHVHVLEEAGLVTKSKDAQRRPCKLNGEGLRLAANWIEEYRAYWEDSLDRLDEYLKSIAPHAAESSTSPAKPSRRSNKSKKSTKGKRHARRQREAE